MTKFRVTNDFVRAASQLQGGTNLKLEKITRLPDADFPFFMGWQKVSDANTPFGHDGLCDIEVLKKMLRDVSDHESLVSPQLNRLREKEETLKRYMLPTPGVREKLRRFVCLAPSEWDSTHNDTRYAKLLDEGNAVQSRTERHYRFGGVFHSSASGVCYCAAGNEQFDKPKRQQQSHPRRRRKQ